MGKKVRSAKGEFIDFDYLKIKEQLASAPTPVEVKNRQNFIENRLKRRLKKKLPVIESAEIDVEPTLPEPADEIVAKKATTVAKPATTETVDEAPTKTTKQRARKKKAAENKE